MSDGALSEEKKRAYSTITTAKYSGESARHNFETYVGQLQNSFEVLAEYDEPVAEAKKVSDFLDGMKGDTNSNIAAAIAHVNGSPTMLEDFTAASDYIATIVSRNKDTLKRREIKTTNTPEG